MQIYFEYCIDSSVWIEAARRKGSVEVKVALEALLEVDEAVWCGPVKLEVLGGATREERRALEHYFEVIPYVPAREEFWVSAKQLSWRICDAGLTVPWNDLLIAAISLYQACRVYAQDQHFEDMVPLTVALYRPGYGGSYNPGEE
jgi:predicted nucleic acid-binding protein